MSYEYFYPGTPYSLDPEYGDIFTGYRIPAGELGASTSIQTANQIKEVTNLLNQGMKTLEISSIRPEVFEMIPKQHLKEINRLTKLTSSETSVHGPMVEASGYNEQGKWSEAQRKQAEIEIASSVERSHELNPEGNIPVTFHTSYVIPAEKEIIKEEGKEVQKSMLIADTRTGEIGQIRETEKFFPEEGGLKKE